MGTYIYTFKKASRNIIDNGEKTIVQHLSYSYKESYSFWPSTRYEAVVRLKEAQAEKSFDTYEGGYIVTCDVRDDETSKLTDLEGQKVWKKLQRSWWRDTGDHGMEYVGYLTKKGRSYELVHAVTEHETEWAKVVAEFHPAEEGMITRFDGTRSVHKPTVQYHFTNKETDETSTHWLKPDEAEYAISDERKLAQTIYSMVI